MYIHLGGNVIRSEEDIYFIFEAKTFLKSPMNIDMMNDLENAGRVKRIEHEKIRSIIFLKGKNQKTIVYYSPITPWTLVKRQNSL